MKNPGRIELTSEQVEELVDRLKNNRLSDHDREHLIDLVSAMRWMNQSLEEKSLSIQRLKKIFGIQTEKSSHILETIEKHIDETAEAQSKAAGASPPTAASKKEKKKAKGHGRLGEEEYTAAKKVYYQHQTLKKGTRCPGCEKGKLCALEYGKLLRITALSPLQATVHKPERLRCATCGEVYTADVPKEVGEEKFDESACSMVSLLRYGYGLPMNRLANLQKNLGMPLPASTQWELITRVSESIHGVFDSLLQMAAQGHLLHNDDTTVKILSHMKQRKETDPEEDGKPHRTGTFTTGIVAMVGNHKILLFFSGRNHAGENLDALLARRDNTDIPIQMCDALSRNRPACLPTGKTGRQGEPASAPTQVANCLTHGRRKFFDVYSAFPEEVKFVIGTLREVYRNDALTKQGNLSEQDRLLFHQEESAPHMDNLEKWMNKQMDENKVEPNSSLGKAIQYMRNHWDKLTCFLRVPGAPLTNDECERLLKTAIRHRRNSLFYKNENGAGIGDMLMSVIQTAIQAEVNPFVYLNALQKHRSTVAQHPDQWLPWNYGEALQSQTAQPNGSSP